MYSLAVTFKILARSFEKCWNLLFSICSSRSDNYIFTFSLTSSCMLCSLRNSKHYTLPHESEAKQWQFALNCKTLWACSVCVGITLAQHHL